jgi:hypothetical protein
LTGTKGSALAYASFIAVATVLSVLLSGCSGSASNSQSAQASRSAAAARAQKQQQREQAKLEAKLKRLQAKVNKSQPTTGAPTASAAPVTPAPNFPQGLTACNDVVSVGPNTSCPFAINVARAYSDSSYVESNGDVYLPEVYSPTTGRYYNMTCAVGLTVVCRGGNNASVYIH